MRVQAVRQKREAIEGAASQDAWALHVAERSMLQVADPDAGPQHAAVDLLGVEHHVEGQGERPGVLGPDQLCQLA